MALFRKRNEEEEQEEELVSKPRRRKKKTEPAKPWGKKERILILLIIIFTAGSSGILALSAREWKLPGVPRIKPRLPSFSFLKDETIILENVDQVAQVEKANEVKSKFREFTKDLSGVYGLYVIDLSTGFSYGVNETETFQAASFIKLPVMAAMFMEEEVGELDLEAKHILKGSDKAGGSGSLYSKPEGYEITYRNLVRLMGKQSDNTAFNIARDLLGDEKINEVINKIGMQNTSLEENETTPVDIGVFFEGLWNNNIINEENKDELLDYLTDTAYEAWIAEGVPDVRVAHKFGRETHVVNDAGIVFSDNPFVLVIMSKGVVEREADEIFPKLAKSVYSLYEAELNE